MIKKTSDYMTFGERLVYARKKKGLNQKQFAKLIGALPSSLCRWEKGEQELNAPMIRKIIKALEVSEDWLLGNDNNFSMKNIPVNQQNIKLTKEQQQLVADNERVIGAVFHGVRRYNPAQRYEDIYGDAALGLCRAAEIYSKTDTHTVSFFSFAFNFVQWAVLASYKKGKTYLDRTTSLDEPIGEYDDELVSLIPAPDESEQIEYKILAESVYQKVKPVLTAQEKEALRSWLYEEKSTELAKKLGITDGTVYIRRRKIQSKCRALFDPDEFFS